MSRRGTRVWVTAVRWTRRSANRRRLLPLVPEDDVGELAPVGFRDRTKGPTVRVAEGEQPQAVLIIGETEDFTSEVVLGQQNLGKALALGMVVIVAIVMWAYARLQRRTSRWLS